MMPLNLIMHLNLMKPLKRNFYRKKIKNFKAQYFIYFKEYLKVLYVLKK